MSAEFIQSVPENHREFVQEKGWSSFDDIISAIPKEGQTASWREGLSEEHAGFLDSKKFEKPDALIDSYRSLEAKLRTNPDRLLTRPEKSFEEDPAAWGEFYNSLGRPESVDGYKIEMPGEPEETVKWAAQTFHELGLTKTQAEQFVQRYNEMVTQGSEKLKEQVETEKQIAADTLKKEWGQAYERNAHMVDQAVQKLGLKEEEVRDLEAVLGPLKAKKLLHATMAGSQEDDFKGTGGNATAMTPAQAKYERQQLMNDPEFVKRYANGDAEAVQKVKKLDRFELGMGLDTM